MNCAGCSSRPDLFRLLAGGVVFIRQRQLRVEASANQQLEQSLLAGGQVLTDGHRLLQLWYVVTQLELHLLLQTKQHHRGITQGRSITFSLHCSWSIICVPFYKYKYIFLKLTVAVYHVLYSTLSSPVYPRSVQISLCRFCLSPLLLCLIPIPRRTLPPPASGLYVWCSPAARDLSSADAASSSPLASPYAAHSRHQRKCCTVTPAGRGSSAAPVVTQRGSSCSEAMVTHKKKNLYS